jgi:hypothetical protein
VAPSAPTFCTPGAITHKFTLPASHTQNSLAHSLTRSLFSLTPSLAGKSASQGGASELNASFHCRFQRRPRGWGGVVNWVNWVLGCEVSTAGGWRWWVARELGVHKNWIGREGGGASPNRSWDTAALPGGRGRVVFLAAARRGGAGAGQGSGDF